MNVGPPGSNRSSSRAYARFRAAVTGRHARITPGRVMTQARLPGTLVAGVNKQMARGSNPVRAQTYEITFTGQAGSTLQAEFDDCEVSLGRGTTTLRAELPDQAALSGLMQRLAELRLEVIDVHRVAPSPGDD